MGISALLFGGKRSTKFSRQRGLGVEQILLTLDVDISAIHTMEAEITEHPVENGGKINDHRTIKPFRYSIEGIISDAKTNLADSIAAQVRGQTARNSFAKLEKLFESEQTFTIATPIKVYRNMMFTKIEVPKNAQTSNALFFNAEAIQVTFVDTEFAILPARMKTRGSDKKNLGQKATKTADAAESKDGESFLGKLVNKQSAAKAANATNGFGKFATGAAKGADEILGRAFR